MSKPLVSVVVPIYNVEKFIHQAIFIKNIKFVEAKGCATYVDAPFGVEVLCKAKRLSIVPRSFYHWRFEKHENSVSLIDKRVIAIVDRFIEAKEILGWEPKYTNIKDIIQTAWNWKINRRF